MVMLVSQLSYLKAWGCRALVDGVGLTRDIIRLIPKHNHGRRK